MIDRLAALLSSDSALTALVSAASLLAVLVPFWRGLALSLRARAATRRVDKGQLRQWIRSGSVPAVEPMALLLARVLRKSLQEAKGQPRDFVVDATKQYVVNEYDSHYARVISMYANLLPPIGFIGTTGGLLILFLSMHMSNATLELGALALALTSSIFALIAFAILEGLKIRLYGRLLACLDDVLALQRATEESREAAGAAV
jgi:hypothetical protein